MIYRPKEFAEMLGVSVKTLQRWDKKGILKACRTEKNRRYYTDEHYAEYLGIENAEGISRYKPKFFAEMLGISIKTLQCWDNSGILKASRTPKNQRYYTDKHYEEYLKIRKAKLKK